MEQNYISTLYHNNIYVGDEKGVIVIFEAGKDLKEIGRNKQERSRANPVFEDGKMYLRTNDHVMCIKSSD